MMELLRARGLLRGRHVLGLRVLFRCDISSMSQRGVRRIFEDTLALAMITPRLSGSTGLVPTTPSPLVYITAFSTQCASATPRVDVDAVMSGLGESLWLENTKSHGGRKRRKILVAFRCSSVLSLVALSSCSYLLLTTSRLGSHPFARCVNVGSGSPFLSRFG